MAKLQQTNILTAIVGAYPKPKYLFPISGRKLIDSTGFLFDKREEEIGKKELKQLIDKATEEAIQDQINAGLDIITDGEEGRSQYIMHILKSLGGIDFKKIKTVATRNGVYKRNVPTITGEILYKKSILINEFLFTKKRTNAMVKIGIPGPSTVVDSLADEYYKGNKEQIAYDYAKAVNHEIAALIQAGCRVIQFDDPVLLRYPEQAKTWGIQALEKCFEGFEDQATFIVHICCGYPNKPLEKKGVSYKANHDYYKDVLSWFAKSKLDVVSIEGAQSNLDLSVLPAVGEKTVMLGVLDVGTNKVETVKAIEERGGEALQYLSKEQLILAPDCGLLEITKNAAYKKLKNMTTAARRLNRRTYA